MKEEVVYSDGDVIILKVTKPTIRYEIIHNNKKAIHIEIYTNNGDVSKKNAK